MKRFFKKLKRSINFARGMRRDGRIYQIPIDVEAQDKAPENYFMMAAIAKNEGPYIEEWIEFHSIVGCSHFLIYDNGSTDQTRAVLAKYVEQGLVTLIPWPNFTTTHNIQTLAYAHALTMCAGQTTWLGFVDLDEFLFPTEAKDMKSVLSAFEAEPAVAVYWSLFGTSGHRAKPDGLVVENYSKRMPYDLCNREQNSPSGSRWNSGFATNFKSIVQPTKIKSTISAHSFRSDRFPVLAVDGTGIEIKHLQPRTVSAAPLQLNHYFSKSEAEWEERLAKGSTMNRSVAEKKRDMLSMIEADPVVDTTIMRFLPELKARMQGHASKPPST